jgi:hypothetical protein
VESGRFLQTFSKGVLVILTVKFSIVSPHVTADTLTEVNKKFKLLLFVTQRRADWYRSVEYEKNIHIFPYLYRIILALVLKSTFLTLVGTEQVKIFNTLPPSSRCPCTYLQLSLALCLSGHWHNTQSNSRRPSVRGLYTGPVNLIDQPLFPSRPDIGETARRWLQIRHRLGVKCRT